MMEGRSFLQNFAQEEQTAPVGENRAPSGAHRGSRLADGVDEGMAKRGGFASPGSRDPRKDGLRQHLFYFKQNQKRKGVDKKGHPTNTQPKKHVGTAGKRKTPANNTTVKTKHQVNGMSKQKLEKSGPR
jgi:hypothetical protein